MPRGLLRRATVATAVLLGAILGGEVFGQLVPKEMPPPVRGLELQNRLGSLVPGDISVFDEQGNAINFGSLFNQVGSPTGGGDRKFTKPLVLLMVYFSCPLQCPQTLEGLCDTLSKVDYTVGHEYDVAIVSFDPRDKPRDAERQKIAMLLSYNRPSGDRVREGWRFLTTPPSSARALADAVGFPFRYLPDAGEFSHPTVVYVLTPEGRVSRQFNGVKFPTRDFRFALLEASDGRVGDAFDKFAFWCYHFDPDSGSYTLQAMRIMQVGAAATVVLLGGLLMGMMLYERRRVRRATAASVSATTTAQISSTESLEGQSDGRSMCGDGVTSRALGGVTLIGGLGRVGGLANEPLRGGSIR